MEATNYKLDEIDRQIVEILQQEPNITYTTIAKKVHRSQPTVGQRIKRLEECGLIKYNVGVSLKDIDMYLAKVEIKTKNPDSIVPIINQCPHIFRVFELSGTNNFEFIIISENLKDLDKVVNYHFRNNPNIKTIKMEIILDVYDDLIVPINLVTSTCKCTL
ncbi:MAG: Lrp/AsnC family transcriptional regulator [Candidatus Lokiarchaeota archaeon]|nr:Lrp/AsnC family transcriptional regulator [Candidatus Lokiarchaeota archaeon]